MGAFRLEGFFKKRGLSQEMKKIHVALLRKVGFENFLGHQRRLHKISRVKSIRIVMIRLVKRSIVPLLSPTILG